MSSLIFVIITSETCPACIALSTPSPGSKSSMLDMIKEWVQPYVAKIEFIRLSPNGKSFQDQLNEYHPDLSKITQAFPSFFLFQVTDWNNKISPIPFERFQGSRNKGEFERWVKNSKFKTSSISLGQNFNEDKINMPEKLPTTGSIHKTIIHMK